MEPITTLNEADLQEIFERSSGPGGQNVNKTSTKVTLRHLPTGITVTVQDNTPAILTIVLNGNEVIITWPQSCTSFHLEEKNALDDAVWSDLGAGQAVGSNYQLTRQVGPGSKFYHLKSQP